MSIINESGVIGIILMQGAATTTGDLFGALMLVMLFLFAICIFFRIPVEFSSLIMLPYCISAMAYYTLFVAPFTVLAIYFSVLIAKNWLWR